MDETIEHEVRIAASPETVFDLWTDPAKIVTWMGRTAAPFEARPGGAIRLDYGTGDVMLGSFLELQRPRRLVFTWGWENPTDPTPAGTSRVEVEIDIERDEAGSGSGSGSGSILRLRHSGLVPAAIAPHEEGWDWFLPRLVEQAESA